MNIRAEVQNCTFMCYNQNAHEKVFYNSITLCVWVLFFVSQLCYHELFWTKKLKRTLLRTLRWTGRVAMFSLFCVCLLVVTKLRNISIQLENNHSNSSFWRLNIKSGNSKRPAPKRCPSSVWIQFSKIIEYSILIEFKIFNFRPSKKLSFFRYDLSSDFACELTLRAFSHCQSNTLQFISVNSALTNSAIISELFGLKVSL